MRPTILSPDSESIEEIDSFLIMPMNEPGLKIVLGGGFFFLRWVGNKQGRAMEIGSDCSRAEGQNLQLATPRRKEETSWEDTEATIIDAASVCEPQEERDFCPRSLCFDLNKQDCVSGPVAQHTNDSIEIEDADYLFNMEIEHDDLSAAAPNLTWDQLVVRALHVVRCREFTEYNSKTGLTLPTRFCRYNIAFFDHDKESKVVPRPPISKVPSTNFWCFEHSVNVISIKVAESDVGYPINIYGTVLARDQYDYRCIYLFKRSKDNPQLIKSKKDTLNLTGPFRALAVTDSMFFEVHLKIKSDDEIVDKDFSKYLLEHNASHHTRQPMAVQLTSCLSTVVMVYSPVPFAVEASLEVKVLKGASSYFNGKVTAWTTENENRITLYDGKVAGTHTKLGTGGFVTLTRPIIAVPLDEGLVLKLSRKAECSELVLRHDVGHDVERCNLKLGSYELQVKVVWAAVNRKRRPKMWEHIQHLDVLW